MVTITERLNEVFALDPGANAVGTPDGTWFSYGELQQAMSDIDALLNDAGLGEGAAVAVLLRSRPANYGAALTLLTTQRCLVTVNPQLPDGPLLEDMAGLSAAAVIADEQDWDRPGFAQAVAAMGALGIRIAGRAGKFTVEAVPSMEISPEAREWKLVGTAVEMLTSGTTGKPKRIRLAYDSLSRALTAGSAYEAGADGVLKLKSAVGILVMPLAHIGGLNAAMYNTYNARSFVLMERFDVGQWHDLVLKYRPKFVNLPPSAFYMVLEQNYPTEDLASLMALRCGSAPLDYDKTIAFETRYGIPVLEAYGATEFAGGVAGWTIRDHRQFSATKRKSVGRANAGIQLRIVDRDTFEPLETNVEGLLEVRSGQLGNGGAWVRTSDLARIDKDGFLFLLGRADSAIIRGGFKVMPDKVEAALLDQPGIKEACVVGIADERLGQLPVAAVVTMSGVAIDEDAVRASLRERLKAYEIPTEIRVVESLPKTESFKISQVRVREMFLKNDEV